MYIYFVMLPTAYPRSEALMVLNDLLYDIFYVQLYIVGAEITLLYLPVYIRYIDTYHLFYCKWSFNRGRYLFKNLPINIQHDEMKNVDISTYHLMTIIMFQYVWFSEQLTKSLKLLRL